MKKYNSKTTEQFIKEAKNIHEDTYDYSLVNYINSYTKIDIICPIHGIFKQQPSNHLNGNKCKKCANDKLKKNRKKPLEKFIEESKIKHNNKYDYSLVVYSNNQTKIDIICPIHGVFKQTPNNHIIKGQGCFKCYHENSFNKSDVNEFIKKSNIKHNNKYDYSDVIYEHGRIKVKIKCPTHGIFDQTPNAQRKGQGCPKCSHLKTSERRHDILNRNKFIEKSNKIHYNKYNYDIVEYVNSQIKVKIICPIHGIFKQSPNNHQKGIGCPRCGIIKNRLQYLEQIKKRLKFGEQISPNFNSKACSFFDELSHKNNIYIQHAMNGGEYHIKELGYWLDGYDINNNIAYEWDEYKHYFKGKLREKDLIRQTEIEKFLKCKFIRIDERKFNK